MREEEFREVYRGTPVIRAKRPGLARNAAIALGNIGHERDVPVLVTALREHDAAIVRGAAAWALPRLAGPAAARPHLDAARRTDPDPSVCAEAGAGLAGS
jgi:epoxyqueuosine reductase